MEEIEIKSQGMTKINGKRFIVAGKSEHIQIKEFTKEDERNFCQTLLDNVYARDIGIGTSRLLMDEKGYFIRLYSPDDSNRGKKKFYLRNFRCMRDPSSYGYEVDENCDHVLLYFDPFEGEVWVFPYMKNGFLGKVEDIKERLLDGDLIK